MALLELNSLSSLLESVSEENTHKIGGKVAEEELALFWLLCKQLSSSNKNYKAELYPTEKGRAENMNSPFTLVTATSNIFKLSFHVERIEDTKVRENSGIKVQFNSSDDVVEELLGYKLRIINKANAHCYWLDL
ncbi:hypothetical protein [Vibrio parahaemolyticus]|uniref:hypothetical protein n=1 Tax=Vibrio parahaemolyticus TaxID=670 RepID=UPI0004120A4E|nr:hypothetical protein [Vibrio parahaemolyticus]TOG33017.1 hypothetical protein CGJ03_23490 [Vibrio parahaemolyticus]HCG8759815.1 hypothetical protein [Vibrio parahaemolyticus]